MPVPTQYTDSNLITSISGYLANQMTAAGWQVYYRFTGIYSGTATQGIISLVPEFPNEPQYLVLPTTPRNQTPNSIILPAFSVRLDRQPVEEQRAGLGQDLFVQRAEMVIDGFVPDRASHLAFATLLRNWFRTDTYISVYDWDSNPSTPALVDDRNTRIENRQVERIEVPSVPNSVRYYLNMTADIVYYD